MKVVPMQISSVKNFPKTPPKVASQAKSLEPNPPRDKVAFASIEAPENYFSLSKIGSRAALGAVSGLLIKHLNDGPAGQSIGEPMVGYLTGAGIGAARGVAEELLEDPKLSAGGFLGSGFVGSYSGMFEGSLTAMIGLALGGGSLAYAGTGAVLGAASALLFPSD